MVTAGSVAAWAVVAMGTLTSTGVMVELSLLANLYTMGSVQWEQHL